MVLLIISYSEQIDYLKKRNKQMSQKLNQLTLALDVQINSNQNTEPKIDMEAMNHMNQNLNYKE